MSKTSRATWAERINAAWRKSVEAILECAHHLHDAQIELGDEEFAKMVEHELSVGRRTVQRLLIIAHDKRLATHVSHLPPSWSTLHMLAHVPDEVFEEAIADGRICPEMTRREAEELLPARQSPQPSPLQTYVHVESSNEPPKAVSVHVEEQVYRPDRHEPEQYHERAVLNALLELETLVGDCDAAALAALVRDDHSTLRDVVCVLDFMAQLKRALGDTGPLH
jgi:hypothetical protein